MDWVFFGLHVVAMFLACAFFLAIFFIALDTLYKKVRLKIEKKESEGVVPDNSEGS